MPENKCGIDNSHSRLRDGEVNIEMYPWFGFLVYPLKGEVITTPVVLITRQLVIGGTLDVGNLPKVDFRARSKVILGHNCKGPRLRVIDYSYHPHYGQTTFSSLVLIQLEVSRYTDLTPICPPPNKIYEANFYAFSLAQDCMSSKVKVMRMTLVDTKECKNFYRRSELDIKSIWPKYTVCAKALRGGRCVWENGVFLVMKQDDRWMLAGFGVAGPGCESPARFLEYGLYHHWVRNAIQRIGRPAITRVAPNKLVLRRRLTNLQRFGPCDAEEKYKEIYTDHTAIIPGSSGKPTTAIYNFTIMAQYDYSCIVFYASYSMTVTPIIHLRRLCLASRAMCYQFSTLQIDFEVKIEFAGPTEYHINVFGEPIKLLDTKSMTKFYNRNESRSNIYDTYAKAITYHG